MKRDSQYAFRAGRRRGFSLLEVVIALAMLALIALPVLGLAVMVADRSDRETDAYRAGELKRRIDIALSNDQDADGKPRLFGADWTGATFWASESLEYIEQADGAGSVSGENDRYYRIEIADPTNMSFDSSYDVCRTLVYRVSWPENEGTEVPKKQLLFTSAFLK